MLGVPVVMIEDSVALLDGEVLGLLVMIEEGLVPKDDEVLEISVMITDDVDTALYD